MQRTLYGVLEFTPHCRGRTPVPVHYSKGKTPCMRTVLKSLTFSLVALLLPATVFAQASLTGTVRDASGGVLPGVTVEAASPALIEKVRTATTDGTGQYRIIDLAPGTYSMTFSLPGFNTVKREGVELSGTQTLTIPVEMRVGNITESSVRVSVTGIEHERVPQRRIGRRQIAGPQ